MIALRGMREDLRPWAEYAVALGRWYGIPVTITSVRRTWSEQATLYGRYRDALENGSFPSARVRYPANAPGDSAHQYGMAFDSTVPPELQPEWNWIRNAIGWSVPSNDAIHAELPGWRMYR